MTAPVPLPPLTAMSDDDLVEIAKFFAQIALDAKNHQVRVNALAREDDYLDEIARRFYAQRSAEAST